MPIIKEVEILHQDDTPSTSIDTYKSFVSEWKRFDIRTSRRKTRKFNFPTETSVGRFFSSRWVEKFVYSTMFEEALKQRRERIMRILIEKLLSVWYREENSLPNDRKTPKSWRRNNYYWTILNYDIMWTREFAELSRFSHRFSAENIFLWKKISKLWIWLRNFAACNRKKPMKFWWNRKNLKLVFEWENKLKIVFENFTTPGNSFWQTAIPVI